MGWLAKGMGGVAAAGALVAFMVFLNHKQSLHGAARWARVAARAQPENLLPVPIRAGWRFHPV
jgi:hypothetical protein